MVLVAKAWHGKSYLSLYTFTFFWSTTWSLSWYLLLCGRCGGGEGWVHTYGVSKGLERLYETDKTLLTIFLLLSRMGEAAFLGVVGGHIECESNRTGSKIRQRRMKQLTRFVITNRKPVPDRREKSLV